MVVIEIGMWNSCPSWMTRRLCNSLRKSWKLIGAVSYFSRFSGRKVTIFVELTQYIYTVLFFFPWIREIILQKYIIKKVVDLHFFLLEKVIQCCNINGQLGWYPNSGCMLYSAGGQSSSPGDPPPCLMMKNKNEKS